MAIETDLFAKARNHDRLEQLTAAREHLVRALDSFERAYAVLPAGLNPCINRPTSAKTVWTYCTRWFAPIRSACSSAPDRAG